MEFVRTHGVPLGSERNVGSVTAPPSFGFLSKMMQDTTDPRDCAGNEVETGKTRELNRRGSVEFDGLTVGSRAMVCFTWHVSRHVVCSLLCESKHALSWAMDIRRIHSHR